MQPHQRNQSVFERASQRACRAVGDGRERIRLEEAELESGPKPNRDGALLLLQSASLLQLVEVAVSC